MAKRRATTDLNHENWDKELEPEDPGTFRRVSEEELKNRVIKKAKRSLPNRETPTSSPFASFSGFSKTTMKSPNPFDFLKNDVSGDESNSTTLVVKSEKKENGDSTENKMSQDIASSDDKKETTNSGSSDRQQRLPLRSLEYYRQLQSLNESVMKWMQLHLSKNPCCDFTPVFKDYQKHLDTIGMTFPVKTHSVEAGVEESSGDAPSKVASKESVSSSAVNHDFKFGNSRSKSEDETDYGANFKANTTNTSTFSFGIQKTPTATSSNTGRPTSSSKEEEETSPKKPFQFSFGLKTQLNTNTEEPNAAATKPFSFASTPMFKSGDSAAVEEEYVPPKNDFVAVREEDAFYSKRCKLFYKKDENFVERGLGVLHLKPLDGKTQLLIRADTSLGNILLNIMLSESLPMSKTGKNNVLLVCVPNPPIDSKNNSKEAIPMLIRVKTSADADELLETLNKHKS